MAQIQNQGVSAIKATLSQAPASPGVYRMFNENGELLYVGKAKNLAARIKSYTEYRGQSDRIAKMVTETRRMELVRTSTETEALLLEQDFIKRLKPKYNITMRDNKSYAYLALSKGACPRIYKHRGAKNSHAQFFGPFPNGTALNESLKIIQDIFKLRTCTDSYFKNRARPCLLHQIKKCSAPCTGIISNEAYAARAQEAAAFLKGRDDALVRDLSAKMESAAASNDYEEAIYYRDQIAHLNQMLKKSPLSKLSADTDVIALARAANAAIIEVMFSRGSAMAGSFSYEPANIDGATDAEIMAAFLDEFYAEREKPKLILSNVSTDETTLPARGDKKRALDLVLTNARAKLEMKLIEGRSQEARTTALAKLLSLSEITRIDVFDNSHISGIAKVGAMIVAGPGGFQKDNYRRYDIKTVATGDDFGMMAEVLTRRYTRAKEDGSFPSLIVLDGGEPQLTAARKVLAKLALDLPLLGLAKTEGHDKGNETLIFNNRRLKLPQGDSILFYLERIRDEAHRFAIQSHRNKRATQMFSSPLDAIEGIGPKKKRALLNYFGSVKNIENASTDELANVEGVSSALAETIYKTFH